jgi:hypothetical protein
MDYMVIGGKSGFNQSCENHEAESTPVFPYDSRAKSKPSIAPSKALLLSKPSGGTTGGRFGLVKLESLTVSSEKDGSRRCCGGPGVALDTGVGMAAVLVLTLGDDLFVEGDGTATMGNSPSSSS